MNDDLFSRLFELFNQPGPVNWKLAAEVARHLSGERQPIDPWAAEELRDLARLAEFHIEQVAPFPLAPASDVIPTDPRSWAERNLESYSNMVEPFATSVAGDGPTGPLFAQMAPVIIGLQAGSLVGAISTWAVAGFDAGLPPDRSGPLTLIIPNLDPLGRDHIDDRELRLWAVANEVAFRAVCALPWIQDHLAILVANYAQATKIDPSKLSGLMMTGGDPEELERAIESVGGIEGLVGGEDAAGPRSELEAFLGAITGCARLLARRGVGNIVPHFDELSQIRDQDRDQSDATVAMIGITSVPAEATQLGDIFNQQVETRYGDDALRVLWSDPTRMPSALELRDPTAWAARVLLDGWS